MSKKHKMFCFKTEVSTGNPLICKRIATALDVSANVVNINDRIIYENEDFQIVYCHNFVDYNVTIYFKILDNAQMSEILLKLMDAMAIEPDYPNFFVVNTITEEDFLLPYIM